MRKLISLALAAITLMSAVACAKNEPVKTSSSASAAENFLVERLGTVPEGVILGDASVAASYGVDMSDFENDGYILRTVGDETLVFGKTEDGLDRAVRKYAKAVQDGTADTINVTYHEGYRIERLTIAGRDISEYTVYYPETANENMRFAADELVRLVKKATGVELSVEAGEPESPAIELRHSDDPVLKEDGYRYFVTDDGLVIEGAVKRGCSNGVWRFLQNECGWDRLIYGDSYLNEADHVDIPVGTEKTETPAFEFFQVYNPGNVFVSDRYSPTPVQNSYGTVSQACHGLQNYSFMYNGEPLDFLNQPCFTSEENYEICFSNVEQFIAQSYGDPNFKEVDISQYDSGNYCLCDTCLEVFLEEGSHSGAVVRFANRLSEEMSEIYPGIVYKIFAYDGTNKPPKISVPNEYVYITFCYDRNCSNHKIDGTECTDIIDVFNKNNADYASWVEKWCELTPNVYVWFYTLGTGLKSYTVIDNLYDDYRYFAEIGVKGIFLETEEYGEFSIKRVEHQLAGELNWNMNMTREEFEELYHSLLEKEYGDGWEYILEYIDQWNIAQDMAGCWHCWEWRYDWFAAEKRYNIGFYKERFDYFVELMELAAKETCSAEQDVRLDRLYASVLYTGCFSSYYYAYLDGDSERMAVLAERYKKCIDIAQSYHELVNFPVIGSGDNYTVTYSPTIEEAAWKDWVSWYERIIGKPLPEDAPIIEKE